MSQNPYGPRPGGNSSSLNVTAPTVIKINNGGYTTLYTFNVVVAGSSPGVFYDNNSTSSGNVPANVICEIPNVVGTYSLTWPCLAGIVVEPGTGQTVAVAFS